MSENVISLRRRDTYVYIDVSNIRLACYKTLGVRLDFVALLQYFKKKYQNLKDVRYYEGIAKGDELKRKMFRFLSHQGYTICDLERKSYDVADANDYKNKCPKCGFEWIMKPLGNKKVMKSNVDVYLASDMLMQAAKTDYPIRLILVSCDGDYAEAIRNIVDLNDNVSVSVLATPFVKDWKKNTLSVRLKALRRGIRPERYMLHDITDILPFIRDKRIIYQNRDDSAPKHDERP